MGNLRQQRIGALIVLCTLMSSSLFLAQGTTGLLAASLLSLDTGAIVAAPSTGVGGGRRERTSDEHILTRNLFDPITGSVLHAPVVPVEGGEGEEGGEGTEVVDNSGPTEACEGNLRLVGALVNQRHPTWSMAAVSQGTTRALLYREGMALEGNNTLVEIYRHKVIVRPSSGRLCHLAMFGEEPRRPAVASRATRGTVEATESEAEVSNDDMSEGITRVSDTEFNVRRELLTQLMGNQAELMRMARVIPHEENGQVVGAKLYGIRRSSLLGRLGVRNGDMLKSLNGLDMTSPDSALQAYAQLPNTNQVTVSLSRRGQDMDLQYNLQD